MPNAGRGYNMCTGGGSSNSSKRFGSNRPNSLLSLSVYTSDDGIQNGLEAACGWKLVSFSEMFGRHLKFWVKLERFEAHLLWTLIDVQSADVVTTQIDRLVFVALKFYLKKKICFIRLDWGRLSVYIITSITCTHPWNPCVYLRPVKLSKSGAPPEIHTTFFPFSLRSLRTVQIFHSPKNKCPGK